MPDSYSAVISMRFDLLSTEGTARRGRLHFARGMFKGMTAEGLRDAGAQIVLGNTFHLMLRPGIEIMRKLGGPHHFMRWDGSILTDSGGFQVWSLAERCKLSEEDVDKLGSPP